MFPEGLGLTGGGGFEGSCFTDVVGVVAVLVSRMFTLPARTVLGLITLYYWPIWNRHKYPPGPFPWPFLGNRLLFLKANNGGYKYFYGKFYTTLGKAL